MANKNKTLGQVQKHIAREQYDRAIKLLQQLVEEDPNDVRSLLKLGDVYVKKGDREVAVDVYKRVARQYSEQGFFMKAVAIYKQILKHQSKNVEALMQLAELYEHLGLASEARQQYLLAESVLQEAGDASAALGLMQKQVELDPDNVAHRIKLAEAYSSQDNVAAATRQFAAAADVLRRQNREDDFIKVAERLVYHDPDRPEILRDLARLYLKNGDAKRALAKLQLCFRSHPKDIDTLKLLAQAFSELRQYARTKTVYQELVQVLEDKGLVGDAEDYRLLIRQLEEADRPTPTSHSESSAGILHDAGSMGLHEGAQHLSGDYGAADPMAMPSMDSMSAVGQIDEIDQLGPLAQYNTGADYGSEADYSASFDYAGTAASDYGSGTEYPASVGNPYAPSAADEEPMSILSPQPPYSGPAGSGPGSASVDAVFDAPMSGGHADDLNGAGELDDLIIEPPVESGDVATTAPPPPPPSPETTVEQQIANLVRDARVYQRYNLPAGALEQLQRALELDPDNVDVLAQMRDLYMTEGDPARAADVVSELVRVHFRNGDRDAAEQARRQIAQLAPNHPLAVDAMADQMPAMVTHDAREDSLSFVITEDSGSFEIVDVSDSGSVPAVDVPDAIADEPDGAPSAQLPEPEFVTGPLPEVEDDEPLTPFSSPGLGKEAEANGYHADDDPSAFANGAVSDVFTDPYDHSGVVATGVEDEEDPTTLGEPVPLQPETDEPFGANGHSMGYALPELPDQPSAEALGSPAALPAPEVDGEAEPVTAQALEPRDLEDLTDELDEVQFFLDVGDEDGARDALRELIDQHPEHPEVLALAMALDLETTRGEKPPTNQVTSADVQAAFDMALDESSPDADPSEVQNAYDEGVALMGIERFAQAIEKFEQAAAWPSMAATAREMLVRCYAKMDQPAQAVAHFRDAESHGVADAAATHLKYLIAASFERINDLSHALEWYESCAADDPTHQDVQEQVKRVALAVYGAAHSDDLVVASDQRNKISYL